MFALVGVVCAVAAQAFALGSIPWGVVLSRFVYHDDVRQHGSGNIGTTNMIRSYGKKIGYACFVLDFTKAILACVLANVISGAAEQSGAITAAFAGEQLLVIIAGFSVVVGHVFSPWLHFRGGKGVACGAGVALVAFGLGWFLGLLALFIVGVAATKMVSVGSLAAACAFPFMGLYVYWYNVVGIVLCFALGILVLWSHRSNIQRLVQGTENKIGAQNSGEQSSDAQKTAKEQV